VKLFEYPHLSGTTNLRFFQLLAHVKYALSVHSYLGILQGSNQTHISYINTRNLTSNTAVTYRQSSAGSVYNILFHAFYSLSRINVHNHVQIACRQWIDVYKYTALEEREFNSKKIKPKEQFKQTHQDSFLSALLPAFR
jgi:hypothetical protein